MELCQNVCFNDSLAEFENGYGSLKNITSMENWICSYMAIVKPC